jgi:uncharacterized protein (TIGR02466 family)
MIKAIDGLFQTPLASFEFEDADEMNSELVKVILEIEEKEKSTSNFQYSMNGPTGYHTKDDLLLRDNLAFKEFEARLKDEVVDWYQAITGRMIPEGTKMVTWAMVYRKGDHSVCHTHPEADISMAYYPLIPQCMQEVENHAGGSIPGSFVCLDPRPAARYQNAFSGNSTMAFIPKQGQGFIFPGWLEHYTTPLKDDDMRICIATNIFIPKGGKDEGRDFFQED